MKHYISIIDVDSALEVVIWFFFGNKVFKVETAILTLNNICPYIIDINFWNTIQRVIRKHTKETELHLSVVSLSNFLSLLIVKSNILHSYCMRRFYRNMSDFYLCSQSITGNFCNLFTKITWKSRWTQIASHGHHKYYYDTDNAKQVTLTHICPPK